MADSDPGLHHVCLMPRPRRQAAGPPLPNPGSSKQSPQCTELSSPLLADAGPPCPARGPCRASLHLPAATLGSWPRLAAVATSALAISLLHTGLQSQLSNKDVQAAAGASTAHSPSASAPDPCPSRCLAFELPPCRKSKPSEHSAVGLALRRGPRRLPVSARPPGCPEPQVQELRACLQ